MTREVICVSQESDKWGNHVTDSIQLSLRVDKSLAITTCTTQIFLHFCQTIWICYRY